jgi:hypothetical protein
VTSSHDYSTPPSNAAKRRRKTQGPIFMGLALATSGFSETIEQLLKRPFAHWSVSITAASSPARLGFCRETASGGLFFRSRLFSRNEHQVESTSGRLTTHPMALSPLMRVGSYDANRGSTQSKELGNTIRMFLPNPVSLSQRLTAILASHEQVDHALQYRDDET